MRGSTAEELLDHVETSIRTGVLRPGDRLPPVREVAATLGTAHVTVASAYRRLRERGLVTGAGRAGTRVARTPPLPLRAETAIPDGVTDLATGNPDERLLPKLPALRPRHVLYGAPTQDKELLGAIAAQLEAEGLPDAQLTLVDGALEGLERVLDAHLRPGDRCAVEDPGFTRQHDLLRARGLPILPLALDQRGVTPETLDAACGGGARAVVLTPRAQNPLGAAFDAERAAELRAVLTRYPAVVVVEDDHAAGIAGVSRHSVIEADRAHWAIVRSWSKALGPDLRCAAVAGDPGTVARVEGRRLLGPGWVSHVLQGLLRDLLQDPATPRLLARAEAVYGERRSALLAALAERGVDAQGASGLCVWVPVREEAEVARALLAGGWAVAPGEAFRVQAPPGVRITTARLPVDEADRLAEAVARATQSRARSVRA